MVNFLRGENILPTRGDEREIKEAQNKTSAASEGIVGLLEGIIARMDETISRIEAEDGT